MIVSDKNMKVALFFFRLSTSAFTWLQDRFTFLEKGFG